MSKGSTHRLGRKRGLHPRTLVALGLLVSSSLAAAEPASLSLFHGPDDTGSMDLKTLRIALDGKDLPLPAPVDGTDPDVAVFTGLVAPGAHKLEVVAALENGASVFTYMDGYKVTLRSLLDIEVLPGEGVAIRSRIVPREGVGLQWQERNTLLLTLSAKEGVAVKPSEVAMAPPAEPASEPASAPSFAPSSATAPAVAAPEPAPAVAAPEPEPVVAVRASEPVAAEPVAPAHQPARVAAAREPEPVVAAAREPEPAPAEPVAEPARRETAPAPARAARAAREAATATRVAKAEATATSPASGDCALEPIRFAFDSAELPAEARDALDRFAACVSATRLAVRVEGHTDARGTDQYNRWLGWDRAAAVSAYLRERGLPERSVSTHFMGKSRPLCDELTEACHGRNRRVEASTRE